jgi:hypothetical protein
VYFNTACALLQHPREGPWLLSAVEHYSVEDLLRIDRPSWVPYWHGPERNLASIANSNHWYRAGGDIKLFAATLRGKVLEVAGFVFDKVVWKSPVIHMYNVSLNPEHWDEDFRATSKPFIDSLCEAVSSAMSNLGFSFDDDDFTLTLVMAYGPNRPKKPNMTRHCADFGEYRRRVRAAALNDTKYSTESEESNGDPYFVQDQLEYCMSLSVIITENGRLGLAPGLTTEVGNACAIFLGATVPFILKPSTKGRYKLVGQGYIHGVMDGELKKRFDLGEFRREGILLE